MSYVDFPKMTEAQRAGILRDNARALYRLS